MNNATPDVHQDIWAAASRANIYLGGLVEAGDGGAVMLGPQNEREWKLLCGRVPLQPGRAKALENDMVGLWAQLQQVAAPGRSSGYAPRADANPAVAAHINAILRDLGHAGGDIADKRAEGAI